MQSESASPGIADFVQSFLIACEFDDWHKLAQQAQKSMSEQKLPNFGFGARPISKADVAFSRRIVIRADKLFHEFYIMSEFSHPRIAKLWRLINWIVDTYSATLTTRARARQAGIERAGESPRLGKSQTQQFSDWKWKTVQKELALAPPRVKTSTDKAPLTL
jgi:hypothetical protein